MGTLREKYNYKTPEGIRYDISKGNLILENEQLEGRLRDQEARNTGGGDDSVASVFVLGAGAVIVGILVSAVERSYHVSQRKKEFDQVRHSLLSPSTDPLRYTPEQSMRERMGIALLIQEYTQGSISPQAGVRFQEAINEVGVDRPTAFLTLEALAIYSTEKPGAGDLEEQACQFLRGLKERGTSFEMGRLVIEHASRLRGGRWQFVGDRYKDPGYLVETALQIIDGKKGSK